MHFTINSKVFLKAIRMAGKNVPNASGTPIFLCILLEAKSTGRLMITGNDSNIAVSNVIDMLEYDTEGQESFKIAVPLEILVKTISTLPSTPITITYTAEGEFTFFIEIAFGSNMFKISCEDPSTFLRLPDMSNSDTLKINGDALCRGISQVVHCISTDNLRPSLCGVNIVVENGVANFTATDGHVAGNYSVEIEDKELSLQILLSGRFASLLAEILDAGYPDVELRVNNRFVRAFAEDWAAYGTKIDASFTSADFIPTEFKFTATINAEEFKTVVKRASIFEDNLTSLIVFNFRDNNLFVRADDVKKNAKADQDMMIESDIEDFRLAFNRKNLERVMSTISGDFDLKMNAANMAAIFVPAADEGECTRYLLMPSMPPSEFIGERQAAQETEA